MTRCYRFGEFELDPHERALRRDQEEVLLQDLPIRLLIALVEAAPRLVSREELRDELWPPGTHLDVDASLNTAVARVREALGDQAGSPKFVTTVPRRGYKFIAPVERIEEPIVAQAPAAYRRWWIAALLALALPLSLWWALGRDSGAEAALGGGNGPGDVAPGDGMGGHQVGGDRSGGFVPSSSALREELLIGRHHADKRTREGLEKSIASYQAALVLDPDNAEAYSGLAVSYGLLGIYDFWRPREAFGPAETMTRRALELDPDSARAQLARSLVAAVGNWDWATAIDASQRALELAPEDAEVWFWNGSLLSAQARHEEAIQAIDHALSLAPTSPTINTALAWYLFRARRYDEAVDQAHRSLDLFPDYYDAWDNLKWIQITLGNEAEAVEAWTRAEEIDNGGGDGVLDAWRQGGLENVHRESIKRETARWESGRYQSPYDVALEYAALGEVDEALDWLDRSFAERETDLTDLAVDPRLDALRGTERFERMIQALNLPRVSDDGRAPTH